ncbi:MAG: LysM peptidoglycan-binding domain-containing protein [Anaerolineales bacterium]
MRVKPFQFIIFIWILVSIACSLPGYTGTRLDQEARIRLGVIVASTLTAAANQPVEETLLPGGQPGISTPPEDNSTSGTSGSESLPTPEAAQTSPSPTLIYEPETEFFLNSDEDDPDGEYLYYTQSGDTLEFVSARFGVPLEQISSPQKINSDGLLAPGQALSISRYNGETLPFKPLLPDSEVVYSPSGADFSIQEYVDSSGGYLSRHREQVYDRWLTGAEIIKKVSAESSVNPKTLLAFLEHRSGWVLGDPPEPIDKLYPIGLRVSGKKGLYFELVMSATQLNKGYYEGRAGIVKELKFKGQERRRLNPQLNAGTYGVQYLFSLFYDEGRWANNLYGPEGFLELYHNMFPGVWERAAAVEPLLDADLNQPELELPFQPGERWSLTGGPHYSWNAGSPRGALDFAPVTGEKACKVSRAWVTASADGFLVRSAHNVAVIDLDGDRFEGSGWNILYLHLAEEGLAREAKQVRLDDRLGHPSCERGVNTGTHVHIARKYNGEWLPADGSVAFILSGWEVFADELNYKGGMQKGEQLVVANINGPRTSVVVR